MSVGKLIVGVGLTLLLAYVSPIVGQTSTAEAENPTPEQIREYLSNHPDFLLSHPDILQQALTLRREREEIQEVHRRKQIVQAHRENLLDSPLTPVQGDVAAAHTLIEFSDYQCEPCRANFPVVDAWAKSQAGVRVIHLQLPIYGPQSILAARAALVAAQSGDFGAYHAQMMQGSQPVTQESIQNALAAAGVPAEVFADRMREPGLQEHLEKTRAFSIELDVVGTPAYVLDGIVMNGAVSRENLDRALADVEKLNERE